MLCGLQIRDLIVPDHEALLKMLASYPRMRKVYRELTPVHGDGSKLCEPLSNGSAGLTPEGAGGVLSREVLGSNTAQRMREAGFVFLEVFEMLGARWMDHATRTDCLHWRVPGVLRLARIVSRLAELSGGRLGTVFGSNLWCCAAGQQHING